MLSFPGGGFKEKSKRERERGRAKAREREREGGEGGGGEQGNKEQPQTIIGERGT